MDPKELIAQLTALVNATDLDERSVASIQTLLVHTLRAVEHAHTEPTDMNHFARIVGPQDTPNDPFTRRICTGPLHLLVYIREDVVGEMIAEAHRQASNRH